MSSVDEIIRFMKDNEEFLQKLFKDTGNTNLGDYWINYVKEKDNQT